MTTFNNGRWELPPQRVRGQVLNRLVALGPQGGATSKEFSAIRRWTAPRDGFITVDSVLGQPTKSPDGVVGTIISSRSGVLGSWNASKPPTVIRLPRIAVKRGDTIDFVAQTRASGRPAPFAWAPIVHMEGGSGAINRWDAAKDFSDGEAGKRLGPWEKFAQVMLETNEMSFVN